MEIYRSENDRVERHDKRSFIIGVTYATSCSSSPDDDASGKLTSEPNYADESVQEIVSPTVSKTRESSENTFSHFALS